MWHLEMWIYFLRIIKSNKVTTRMLVVSWMSAMIKCGKDNNYHRIMEKTFISQLELPMYLVYLHVWLH